MVQHQNGFLSSKNEPMGIPGKWQSIKLQNHGWLDGWMKSAIVVLVLLLKEISLIIFLLLYLAHVISRMGDRMDGFYDFRGERQLID